MRFIKTAIYLIFFLLAAVLFVLPASARSIRLGIYSLPWPYQTQTQIDWLKNNFDLIAGVNATSVPGMTKTDVQNYSGFAWASYLDIATLGTLSEYLKMVDYANSVSINTEEMLLHAKANFTYVRGAAWLNIDKFDAFENAKGVMLESGGVFTDKTTVAYSGASPFTTINQNLYIGYELPFDQANFNIRTAASGLIGTWQYWNGSDWATLTATDGTSVMTVTGTLSFIPPPDWARVIVNGSRNKYFIRFAYVSAITAPVINTIKGDTWVNDGVSSHCRGWDATSGTIINSGELAYNPTPPAGASAKFRYQSRIPTWSVNHFVYNFADYQMISGVLTRTTSAFIASRTVDMIAAAGWSGMMYDDATAGVTVIGIGIDYTNTDFVDKAGGADWKTVENAKFSDLSAIIKATFPDVKLGANSKLLETAPLRDWNLYEYINKPWGTGDQDNTNFSTSDRRYGNMTYDDYLPPNASQGFLIYDDTYSKINGRFWDRANRGPMSALSKHLIGWNSNVLFGYISEPNAWYSWIDDVLYLDPLKGTTLTQPLSVDTSSAVKYIHVADASQFPTSNIEAKIDGANPEVISYSNRIFTKIDNTTLSTTAAINFTHSVGDVIRFAEDKHLSDGVFRSVDDIYRYTTYFPAMSVDFGAPISARNMAWVTGVSQGWPNLLAYGTVQNTNVWRRDYTNCIVLHRPSGGASSAINYDEYSNPLPLGGTYYSLKADGTTGPAITEISLRRAEGAILMKAPLGNDVVAPSAPSGLSVM